MSVAEKQRQIIEDLAFIENRQERLAAIVERARRLPTLTPGEKTEQHRVTGCVSAVWLLAKMETGHMHFKHDADSPLVRGLVALLCEMYEGGLPGEIVTTEPAMLEELDLVRDLTPTRRNGLTAVRARIKALALKELRDG